MRLKIVTVGEPGLRAVSQELSAEQIRSSSIQNLIGYMRETLRDAPGVGLAAPQVGESLQFAVIEDKAEYQKTLSEADLMERGRTEVPFHVIVNPTIVWLGKPAATYFEGCLSLPGFTALVPRARECASPVSIIKAHLGSSKLPDGTPVSSSTKSIICTAGSISTECMHAVSLHLKITRDTGKTSLLSR